MSRGHASGAVSTVYYMKVRSFAAGPSWIAGDLRDRLGRMQQICDVGGRGGGARVRGTGIPSGVCFPCVYRLPPVSVQEPV